MLTFIASINIELKARLDSSSGTSTYVQALRIMEVILKLLKQATPTHYLTKNK